MVAHRANDEKELAVPEPTRIVILGGGFAGTAVARRLEQIFHQASGVEITLVDRENFSPFTPLLREVPSGALEPKHIVSSRRWNASAVSSEERAQASVRSWTDSACLTLACTASVQFHL